MKLLARVRDLRFLNYGLPYATPGFSAWCDPAPSWQSSLIDLCWPLYKRYVSRHHAETQALLMLVREL